jgi:hypothetical protein
LRTGKFTVECPCPDAFRALVVVPTGVTKWGAQNNPNYEIVYEEWSALRVAAQSYPGATKYPKEDLLKFQATLLKRGARVTAAEIEKDPILLPLGPRHFQYAKEMMEVLEQMRKKLESIETLRQGIQALDIVREGYKGYRYYNARMYGSIG